MEMGIEMEMEMENVKMCVGWSVAGGEVAGIGIGQLASKCG